MNRRRFLFFIAIIGAAALFSGGLRAAKAYPLFQEAENVTETDSGQETENVTETDSEPEKPAPESPVPEYPIKTETGRQIGFYWAPSEGAESYEVSWKNDSGGEGSVELENTDSTCQMGRCAAYEEVPADGTYTWTVKAVNEAGEAVSEEAEFFVRSSLPAPEAYRPNVVISSQKALTFEWEDIRSSASEYRIQVMDRETERILRDQWYRVSDMYVGNGVCYMETGVYLPSGSYAWRVKAKNSESESKWSSWVDFQTNCADCALGAYLNTTTSAICPQGSITDLSPEFEWLAVTGAAYYVLNVTDANGSTILDVSVPPANCSLESCSFDPGFTLASGGAYQWSVSTYGGNNGRWGTDTGTITAAEPAEVRDISFVLPEEGGKLDAENPLIIWTDPGQSAADFRLVVVDAAGELLFYGDLNSEDAWCDGKTCSIVFRTIPEGDNYVIYITPYSETNTAGGTISLTFSR